MLKADFPAWHFHPDVWTLILLLAGAYWFVLRREAAKTGQPAATVGQRVAFYAGVGVLFVASDWPVHDLGEGHLYSAHMVQHLLVTLLAAPLLLLGMPAWLMRRLLSPKWLLAIVKAVAKPVPNLLQANLILVLSHWPIIVTATLRHHELHFVAHAVLLASALVMWLPVVSNHPDIPRLPPILQMLYLFVQTIVPTIPASFLTLGHGLLYPIYGTFPRIWGISATTDQQVAGLIMKIGAGMYLWALIGTIFFRWYADEERRHPPGTLLWDDVERELDRLDESPKKPTGIA